MTTTQSIAEAETFAATCGVIIDNVATVVQGKRDVIRLMMLCMLSEGHLLIEDVPGVGKTSLAKAFAGSIHGSWGRIQFTPDLLPADVVGVTVWNRNEGTFDFRPGPVFNNIVLGDEINRASPKTQSALLESMEERQVTVDGNTYQLARPFMVIATQNPIEHEGTFPLPESQLDRFLMRLSVGYPSPNAELEVLTRHGQGDPVGQLQSVVSIEQIKRLIEYVTSVHIAEPLRHYLVALASATRTSPLIALGMSPRATLNLQRAARAHAALDGRPYVTPDDVKGIALQVLTHRILLTPDAQLAGHNAESVLEQLLSCVPIPDGRSV